MIDTKGFTSFIINKRCAELLGVSSWYLPPGDQMNDCDSWVCSDNYNGKSELLKNYCENPADTNSIINICFDDLIEPVFCTDKNSCEWYQSRWSIIIEKYNCSILEAACIYLVEVNK